MKAKEMADSTGRDTVHGAGLLEALPAWIGDLAQRGLRNLRKGRIGRRMELIETLPLGGKRQLILIACDGRHFLVGAGADAVSSITPIPLPDSGARYIQ
jgi:hypothetical protein